MDTLPNDLLQLIDGHTSFVEETLLAYSSKYLEGVKAPSWKCFLHHRHRKYDKYDLMFLYEDVDLEMLIYAIDEQDLIAFTLVFNTFEHWKLMDQLSIILNRIICSDNKQIFLVFRSRFRQDFKYKILMSGACNILSLYNIDDIDINSITEINRLITILIAANFNHQFIKRIINTVEHNFDIGELMCCLVADYTDVFPIVNIMRMFNCSRSIVIDVLFCAMEFVRMEYIQAITKAYELGTFIDLLTEYSGSRCDQRIVKLLRELYNIKLITGDELLEVYNYKLEISDYQRFESLKDYKWIIKHYPSLDVLFHNNTVLEIHYDKPEIALYILNLHPELPLKKLEIIPNKIDGLVYLKLYQRNKIVLNIDQIIKFRSIKIFMYFQNHLDDHAKMKWMYYILLEGCCCSPNFDQQLDNIIRYLDNKNITIDYQRILEIILSSDYVWITLTDISPDFEWFHTQIVDTKSLTRCIKIMDSMGKIKDYYRLMKLTDEKEYVELSRYLSSMAYSRPLYNYS